VKRERCEEKRGERRGRQVEIIYYGREVRLGKKIAWFFRQPMK